MRDVLGSKASTAGGLLVVIDSKADTMRVASVVAGQRHQHGTDQRRLDLHQGSSRRGCQCRHRSSRRGAHVSVDGGRWSQVDRGTVRYHRDTPGHHATLCRSPRARLHCCQLLIEILMRLLSVRCPDREVVAETSLSCVNQPILYQQLMKRRSSQEN